MPAASDPTVSLLLCDMACERQYVTLCGSDGLRELSAYEESGRVALAPDTKIFAISDAVSFIADENKTIARTLGCEIAVDGEGKAQGWKLLPLEFEVEHATQGNKREIHYLLTGGSAEALSELGMDVAGLWEKKFTRTIASGEPFATETALALPPRFEAIYRPETARPVAITAPLKFRKPAAGM